MVQFLGKEFEWSTPVLGTTVEFYVYYIAFVLFSLMLGRAAQFVMETYGRRLAQRTKTDLDDLFIDALVFPARYVFFFLGLTIAGELFLTFPSTESRGFYFKVVGIIGLAIATYTLVHLIDLFSERVLRRFAARTKSKLDDQLVPLLKRSLKYAVVGMALLLALDNFGYDITALLAGLGIGGLAIAFAAQETIKDVFGGLVIFSNKTFFVGDRITLEGQTGTVEAINLRTTLIRNWEGRIVTIPNSKVASSTVENWARAKARRTFLTLQLTYDTSSEKMAKAKEILRRIAQNTPGIVQDSPGKKEVLVWFSNFGAHSLDINFIYFVADQDNLLDIWDAVNMAIKREFEKAKIEFAYPTQTVFVRK